MIVGLALIGLAVTGCSSDDQGTDSPPPSSLAMTSTAPSATTTPPPPPSETVMLPPVTLPSEPSLSLETSFAELVPGTIEPTVQPVTLGAYCSSRGASATAWDGSTAYCSRLAGTDAYIWSLTAGVAPNPELQQYQTESNTSAVSVGQPCYERGATSTNSQGRTIYCSPTMDGTLLFWALQP